MGERKHWKLSEHEGNVAHKAPTKERLKQTRIVDDEPNINPTERGWRKLERERRDESKNKFIIPPFSNTI